MAEPGSTWMPFYIADYLRDTGHLTVSEHGCYMLLLMQGWPRNGLLPLDDERLRMLGRMNKREWKRSRETILAFFTRTENGYRQKRLDKEISIAGAIVDQRKAAGRTAGLASAAKRAAQREVNEDPTIVQRSFNDRSKIVGFSLNENVNDSPTNGQRKATPSPSPSPKESAVSTNTQSPRARARGGGRATPAMPTLNSDWSAWEWLTGGEVEICGPNAQRRPCAGDSYVDGVARDVAEAAGIDGFAPGIDWRPIVTWLREGIHGHLIVEAVKKVASRADYEPKTNLKYFAKPVHEIAGKPVHEIAGKVTA